MQGAFGLDFGSSRTVMGAATRGGVKILINEGSNRETGNYISFGQKQRFIGETGQAQKMSNFKNTINFFNRFLGMKTTDPQFKEESQYITVQPVQDKEDVEFQVTYQGNQIQMNPQQLIATMLGKIQKQIINEGFDKANDMVISVPSYYNEKERKAMLDACKIAEINAVKLFNESSAVALSYGIFRRKDLTSTAKNVVFIDLGHSKLSAYCAAFTSDKCQILAEEHARNVGCRNIDWEVLKHFSAKFKSEKDIDPIKNVKARLRMLDAIEKMRKVLSANSEGQINIECLLEDEDMSYNLTRVDFESLIKEQLSIMQVTLANLAKKLEEKNIKYQDIEIIGGGSRIPAVQQMILDTFKGGQIMRTLNSSECIARGCSLMSAMMSPLFKVADYGVDEFNLNPINVTYSFVDPNRMEIENEKVESKTSLLFPEGCNIPCIKSLSFARPEHVHLQLNYVKDNQLLAQYDLNPKKIKEQDFKQKIRIKLGVNGIVEITEYSLEETYTEEVVKQSNEKKEEKKDEKKEEKKDEKKEEEEKKKEPEVEIKTKTRTTILKYQPSQLNQFTEQQLKQFFEIEVQMRHSDNLILETLEKKNDLESYIYNMRSNLQDSLKNFIQQDQVQPFLDQLQKEENWLYDDGYNAQKSEYVKRLNGLKLIGDPVTKRHQEYSQQPEIIAQFQDKLKKYYNLASQNSEEFNHINQEEKNQVIQRCQELGSFLQQNIEKQQQSPLYFDLVLSNSDLIKKMNEFEIFAVNIMNKPKPKVEPKKEEKKEEAKQEQQQNQDKPDEVKTENPDQMEIE